MANLVIKLTRLVLFKSDEVGPRQTSYLLVVFLPPMHQIQRNAMKQSPSERFSRTIMYHDLLWKLEINMTFNNREKDWTAMWAWVLIEAMLCKQVCQRAFKTHQALNQEGSPINRVNIAFVSSRYIRNHRAHVQIQLWIQVQCPIKKTSRAQITDCQKHTLTDKQLPAYLFLPLDVRHLVSCLESGGSMANKKLIRRQLNVHVCRLNVANLTAQNSRLKIFRNTIQWLKDLKHQWIILSRHKKQFVCLIFGDVLRFVWWPVFRVHDVQRRARELARNFGFHLICLKQGCDVRWFPSPKELLHATTLRLLFGLWQRSFGCRPLGEPHIQCFFFCEKKTLTWPGVCLINR